MASGGLNRHLGAIGRLEGSLGGPKLICHGSGVFSGRLGASFLEKDRVLECDFSTCFLNCLWE